MTPELQGEINKYLSKKNPYYSRFSQELIDFLEESYPTLPTTKARWTLYKDGITEFEIPPCGLDGCNKQAKWNIKFNRFDSGCCADHTKRITSIKNFGTEHPNQNKKQLEKVKKSVREKYGVDYVTQIPEHNAKRKKTNLEKYGVEEITSSPEIRAKIEKTNLEKYGNTHPLSDPRVREKIKQTNIKKYGSESSLSNKKVRAKINKTNLQKYGSIFPMRNEELIEKRRNYIIEKYDSYSPLMKKDDGDKYYHLDKSIEAENKGEMYYHFFKYETLDKTKQIEWLKEKIILRSVQIVTFGEVSFDEMNEFIKTNSLYPNDSEIRQMVGIYAGEELVGIVSGYEKSDFYEITRFVIKIGYKFSENLYTKFIEYIDTFKQIIITLDRRFTSINQPELEAAGFEFIGGTEPTMYYLNDYTAINSKHRNQVERLNLDEYREVWDCGKLVFKKV
jgi:hypothetical protein